MVDMSWSYLVGKGKKGILWNTSNRMNERLSYDVAVFMAKNYAKEDKIAVKLGGYNYFDPSDF